MLPGPCAVSTFMATAADYPPQASCDTVKACGRLLTWEVQQSFYYCRPVSTSGVSPQRVGRMPVSLLQVFLDNVFWHIPAARLLPTSRVESWLLIAYIICNIFAILCGASGWKMVGNRTGILATINLAPLLIGPQLDLVANVRGISMQRQLKIHSWIALGVTVMTILHSIIFAPQLFRHWLPRDLWGASVGWPITRIRAAADSLCRQRRA